MWNHVFLAWSPQSRAFTHRKNLYKASILYQTQCQGAGGIELKGNHPHPPEGWENQTGLFRTLSRVEWGWSPTRCCPVTTTHPPISQPGHTDFWPQFPMERKMATHSSILVRRISWTEELGRLQPMGSQRVRHDWVTLTHSPGRAGPLGGLWLRSPFGDNFKLETQP